MKIDIGLETSGVKRQTLESLKSFESRHEFMVGFSMDNPQCQVLDVWAEIENINDFF